MSARDLQPLKFRGEKYKLEAELQKFHWYVVLQETYDIMHEFTNYNEPVQLGKVFQWGS